ncbi:MAG: class I lanthipeptide [Acidobacteriota bacterium]
MKKRRIESKLSLRKDTLRTLGEDHLSQAAGGVSAVCNTDFTCNQICIETTLARGCVHHNTVGCNDTIDCTASCGCNTASGGANC